MRRKETMSEINTQAVDFVGPKLSPKSSVAQNKETAAPSADDQAKSKTIKGQNHPLTNRAIRALPVIAVAFGGLYVLSNVLAVKSITLPFMQPGDEALMLGPVQVWPLVLDGAFILFPLTYIIDDVLAEVYGFKTARAIIFAGFTIEVIAVLMIGIDAFIPATPDTPVTDELFGIVLGYVPRIICASLAAFVVGELLNAYVLVKIREKTGEKKLWMRLLGSTVVGEAADTITFCTVAFIGTISWGEFLNYTILGYLCKCGIEVILLPVTYRVIAWLKDTPSS
jgi:uncharacterized integral membrane protein (TIGR00697 family)